jgi:hypothetical protein
VGCNAVAKFCGGTADPARSLRTRPDAGDC